MDVANRKMTERFWDEAAHGYREQFHSVFDRDRGNVVQSCIEQVASAGPAAADLGCGVGLWLAALAQRFERVTAVDISRRSLAQARRQAQAFDHVRYVQADLTKPGVRLPRVDVVLSVNAIIMPSESKRAAFWSNLQRCVRRGGKLVLITPALESAMMVNHRLAQWHRRDGASHAQAWRDEGGAKATTLADLRRGILAIDHTPTKFHMKEELAMLLDEHRFVVESINKVEYDWTSEFESPPRWMRGPYPWDWLAVATRR